MTEKKSFKERLGDFGRLIKHYARRVWEYLKVAKMEYIVMISLFALDLISKAIVDATVNVGDTVVLIPYVLNIHYTRNPNAAFGSGWMKDWLGAIGARIFFCVFAVAASVVFILVLIKHKGGSKLFRVALAMLTAGAMGNCIDRWAYSYVRDFVEFVYFGLTIFGRKSFYIFNIADAELVIGVVLVVIYFIFVYKEKSDEKKHADEVTVADSSSGGELPTESTDDANNAETSAENDIKESDDESTVESDNGESSGESHDNNDNNNVEESSGGGGGD